MTSSYAYDDYDVIVDRQQIKDGAVGDRNNDNIITCKICKSEGFPHEAIVIEKVKGRVLSNGINEIIGYKILDYASDLPHYHKYQRYFEGFDLGRFFE